MIEAAQTLADEIQKSIPGLNVRAEWPRPDEQLRLPSMSIITMGQQKIDNRMPILFSTESVPGNDDLVDAQYNLGEYNLTLQADLWAEYKAQRSEFYARFQNFMDREAADGGASGVSLRMKSYFNRLARFDLIDFSYDDNMEMSQQGEWRARFTISCHYDRIKVERLPRIKAITLQPTISEDIS